MSRRLVVWTEVRLSIFVWTATGGVWPSADGGWLFLARWFSFCDQSAGLGWLLSRTISFLKLADQTLGSLESPFCNDHWT